MPRGERECYDSCKGVLMLCLADLKEIKNDILLKSHKITSEI